MGLMKSIRLVAVYIVGFLWLVPVTLLVITLAIRKRGKFFYKKNRTVEPAVFQEKKYGEHCYIQLKVDYVIVIIYTVIVAMISNIVFTR